MGIVRQTKYKGRYKGRSNTCTTRGCNTEDVTRGCKLES